MSRSPVTYQSRYSLKNDTLSFLTYISVIAIIAFVLTYYSIMLSKESDLYFVWWVSVICFGLLALILTLFVRIKFDTEVAHYLYVHWTSSGESIRKIPNSFRSQNPKPRSSSYQSLPSSSKPDSLMPILKITDFVL